MTGPMVNPARFGPRQAQPLDGFMADAKDVLQGLFDKPDTADLPAPARIAIESQQHIRAIAARKFADAEGEELLEALCDAVLRKPFCLPAHAGSAEQRLAYADQREGQAHTIYLLLAWIAEGRSEQQPQREGATNVSKWKRPKRKTKSSRW
jgi:hypothetical protein